MKNTKSNINDEFFIERCIELAKKGAGYVSPNPLVGCLIVKNGKIIAEGYHKKYGTPHAEVNAINDALARKINLRGSSLYVNLEPCAHIGKTPPCTDKIIESKIAEVIIGIRDPNRLVSGKGIKKLIKAKIKVRTGILENQCRELNKFYFKHITSGLPYVTLKTAQTIDGKIADAQGVSKWISSMPSRKLVHKLRSEYDAVLIGRKTVENDNPQLTVRHIKGRNPFRIVMDKQLIPNLNSNLFSDENTDRTIIVTSSIPDEFLGKLFEQRKIRVINAKLKDDRIDLTDALKNIGKTGIASILVEGGAYTYTEFIRQNAADELLLFISPRMMGKGIGTFSFEEQFSLKNFKSVTCGISGDDIVLSIKLK